MSTSPVNSQVLDPFMADYFTVGRSPDGGLLIAKKFGDFSQVAICVAPAHLQDFLELVADVVLRARAEGFVAHPEARDGH